MHRISLVALSENRGYLSGLVGRQIYPRLVESIQRQEVPSPIFLDFSGIMASGSFFSQAVLPLRHFARRMDAYLVLCNLDRESEDELRWLLELVADAVYVCELANNDEITNPRWLGNLEDKQRLTLSAVQQQKGADASLLAETHKDENIGITGWNNRLVSLNKKGLLMEIKTGRSKSYRPVLNIAE